MQLVKTERDNLLRPLQTVSGIVERRHTLADPRQLADYQERRRRVVHHQPTSSCRSPRAPISACGGDNVATTVAARKLLDILRAMPAGQSQRSTLSATSV